MEDARTQLTLSFHSSTPGSRCLLLVAHDDAGRRYDLRLSPEQLESVLSDAIPAAQTTSPADIHECPRPLRLPETFAAPSADDWDRTLLDLVRSHENDGGLMLSLLQLRRFDQVWNDLAKRGLIRLERVLGGVRVLPAVAEGDAPLALAS